MHSGSWSTSGAGRFVANGALLVPRGRAGSGSSPRLAEDRTDLNPLTCPGRFFMNGTGDGESGLRFRAQFYPKPRPGDGYSSP